MQLQNRVDHDLKQVSKPLPQVQCLPRSREARAETLCKPALDERSESGGTRQTSEPLAGIQSALSLELTSRYLTVFAFKICLTGCMAFDPTTYLYLYL